MTAPNTSFDSPRPDLAATLMVIDLAMNQMGYVAREIAPELDVAQAFGVHPKIDIEELLRAYGDDELNRAPGSHYPRIKGKGGQDTFVTKENGLEEPVDQNEAAMYEAYWDAEALAVSRCRDGVLATWNQRVISNALGIGNTTGVNNGAWSAADSTPITDVKEAKIAMRNRIGVAPNSLCLDWEAHEEVRNNAQVVDRLKYAGFTDPNQASMNAAVMAQVFDVQNYIVSDGVKNVENYGKTADINAMWDRTKALLFRRDTGRDLRRPQFMRTFHWSGDGSQIGGTIDEYYEDQSRSDIKRCRMQTQEKIIMAECGEVITGILS